MVLHSNSINIKLFKTSGLHFFKRTMMSANLYTARAAYYCMKLLTDPNILDATTAQNKKPLITGVVKYGMDDTQGIIQHKGAILHNISTKKYPLSVFYEIAFSETPQVLIHPDAVNATGTFRTVNELRVCQEIVSTYGSDIVTIQATGDSLPVVYPGQQQSNPDWLLQVMSKVSRTVDGVFGLNQKTITRYVDEKSGMDMFKHSTSGSAGILYYDSNLENVQVMSNPISLDMVRNIMLKNTNGIENAIKHDLGSSSDDFDKVLYTNKDHLKSLITNQQIFEQQPILQARLWDNLQCNPEFTRSLSLIFLKRVPPMTQDADFLAFKNRFCELLEPRLYNLSKKGDVRAVLKAMLQAFQETKCPNLKSRLHHLQYNANVEFTQDFLYAVANILKNVI